MTRIEKIEFERRALTNELAVGLAECLKDTHPMERHHVAQRYADETIPSKWDYRIMESIGGAFSIVLTGYDPYAEGE
jgi:hypothetical protein